MIIVSIFVDYIVPLLMIVLLLCLRPFGGDVAYKVPKAYFRNCTNDTLYIGASHYDNIDSLESQIIQCYFPPATNNLDTVGISLWKGDIHRSVYYVFPDSTCLERYDYLFQDHDTCYFFLIKYSDAKRYSWDEIRKKRLYKKWVVTKKEDDTFDRDIRYLGSDIIHGKK